MTKKTETFAEQMKRESKGFHLLDPDFVEREKRLQTGHLIQLYKKMGRPLTEKELEALGNIL